MWRVFPGDWSPEASKVNGGFKFQNVYPPLNVLGSFGASLGTSALSGTVLRGGWPMVGRCGRLLLEGWTGDVSKVSLVEGCPLPGRRLGARPLPGGARPNGQVSQGTARPGVLVQRVLRLTFQRRRGYRATGVEKRTRSESGKPLLPQAKLFRTTEPKGFPTLFTPLSGRCCGGGGRTGTEK